MQNIKLHYLLGDVHMGGHDVHRVAKAALKMLNTAGCFDVLVVCDTEVDCNSKLFMPAESGDKPNIDSFNEFAFGYTRISFDEYFASGKIKQADAFIFNCGNWRFNVPAEQAMLEEAVAAGAGFMLMHGDHPCYWPAAGMAEWQGFERMAGFLWREKTTHGDFGDFHITIDNKQHPIVAGLEDFDTRDEVFCTMENPWNVPFEVLASAYSDPNVISRHGQAGTGKQEPVAITGQFGKGRTYNQGLGHVWPYYTGHGLGENTMVAWLPTQQRVMFVRACEWIATGVVERTLRYDGKKDNITQI